MIVFGTIGCALLTLWLASAPVASGKGLRWLAILWPVLGGLWAISIAFLVRRRASLLAAVLLFLGAAGSFAGFLPFFGFLLYGWPGAVVAMVLAVGLLGLILAVERPARIVWLAAPAIVLSTVGLALSELPRLVRFGMSEPALTTFAVEVIDRSPIDGPVAMDPTRIGGIRVQRAFVRDGCAHLVTAHIGLFGGRPAGIAYCPSGPQSAGREYDPLEGAWYRWWQEEFFD